MLFLLFFIFGTVIGSFLIVVVDRLPQNRSIVKGRSVCESCGHILAWDDLVPIFSYILLRGKCRYCHVRFGPHYMLLELVVGFLFVVTYAVTVSQVSFFTNVFILLLLYRLLLLCGLFVLFFIDLRLSVIPSSVLVYLGVVGILGLLLFPAGVITTLLSAVGAFLFFLLIFLITKGRGMGFGDVLFAFVMGLILGFPSIVVAVYIAFLTGALVSLILVLRGRKKLKSAIPFGPFLVAGTVLCLLWGEQLSHIFLSLLRIV